MKTRILKYAAAAMAMFAFASCNDIVDYDDGYTALEDMANTGAPKITGVYNVADTLLTTPLAEGQPGQMVRIVGENLNNVKTITFNTVEADLSQVYTYSTSANVVIPSELSRESQNKIVYTTDKGTAEFDFVVPYPQLRVDGMVCEYVNAGDSVTITGQNFDYYDFGNSSQVTVNGTPLGVGSITNTQMKALVPEGTADNSTLLFTWTDGTSGQQMTATLTFRPNQNLLYGDFSDVTPKADGSYSATVEGDDALTTGAAALGRPHIHVTGTSDAWGWNTIDLERNMIDAGDLTNLDDYVLKFEVLTASDNGLTEASPLQFSFNWGDSYTWNPGDGFGLNTHGEWQTITLPLAPMATNGIVAPGTWMTLRLVLSPSATYTADFRLANFRIEHK